MHIVDAIEVTQSESEVLQENPNPIQEIQDISQEKLIPKEIVSVPDKIKKESILDWAGFSPNEKSDKEILKEVGIEGQEIPSWFKKVGRWIFEGQISLADFENALNNLHKRGVV